MSTLNLIAFPLSVLVTYAVAGMILSSLDSRIRVFVHKHPVATKVICYFLLVFYLVAGVTTATFFPQENTALEGVVVGALFGLAFLGLMMIFPIMGILRDDRKSALRYRKELFQDPWTEPE